MRWVKVFHSSAPDFVVGVPDEAEDTDLFLDEVLHGADGWSEAKEYPQEAEWENRKDWCAQ